MATPRNLVFVTIDCLREDFVSGDWAKTPFLNKLAERGIEFRDLHATTTTTAPSIASVLTGTYSEKNGVNSLREGELNEGIATMPRLFSDAGFESTGLLLLPLAKEIGFHRGFDEYYYRKNDDYLVRDWYETAIERIENLSEPFLLYIHLWELHVPGPQRYLPVEFDEQYYGQNPYARMLSAIDRRLEGLFDTLPKNTVKVVHADHGESISWRESTFQSICKRMRDRVRYDLGVDTRKLERVVNRFFDVFGPSYHDHFLEDGHGETVFDFMTNVPFIINGPKIDATTVTEQCRQVDVLPTLLDIMDVKIPEYLDGESLLPPGTVEDRDAYLRACGTNLRGEENWNRGIRTPEYKYFEYSDRDWSHELYDLTKDEKELRNVAKTKKGIVSNLQSKLPEEDLMDVGHAGIDEHLRDLGYL